MALSASPQALTANLKARLAAELRPGVQEARTRARAEFFPTLNRPIVRPETGERLPGWLQPIGSAAREFLERRFPRGWARRDTGGALLRAAEVHEVHLHLGGPPEAYLYPVRSDDRPGVMLAPVVDVEGEVVEAEERLEEVAT